MLRFRSLLALSLLATPVVAGDWPAWRGPLGNSVSTDTGLPSTWSPDGENLLWKAEWIGRSTPVVFDGRVCVNGRAGEDQTRQEAVACFDAATGTKLWEYRFHVVHSTVPWTRVGWANPTIDPETGWLYIQGVGGEFVVLDRDGKVVWHKNLMEEYGFMEGYGGRTQTPVIDEDRLIITFASNSWGDLRVPRHRLFAFDKRTGEMLWWSSPAQDMADKNSQSTPALLFANGRRLLVHGNGSGDIFAVDSHTGELVWQFELSQRAINSSVTVEGTTVYAVHGEENVDEPTMGRAVAIDGTGTGNVTKTHELWRHHLESGFTSPLAHGGRVYITTISGEVVALDAKTGEQRWGVKIGRIGRGGSPVWADGKILATEVNGTVAIIEPGDTEAKLLSRVQLRMPNRRPAELWGSVAVANGRIYFTTEEGLYCLGNADAKPSPTPSGPAASAKGEGTAAVIASHPAEARIGTTGKATFRAAAFDALRRPLGTAEAVWSIEGLKGSISADGTFTPDAAAGAQLGKVVAKVGELTASSRVRVLHPGSFSDDFESLAAGATPAYMMHAIGMFKVEQEEGNRYLVKNRAPREIHRHHSFIGPPELRGATIKVDVRGTKTGDVLPDIGVATNGYTLDFLGLQNRLQIKDWHSALRIEKQEPMTFEPMVWYTMKLTVDHRADGTALIRGKVWRRDAPEPEAWSIEIVDPLPIATGAPALFGNSETPIHFDNLEVTAK